MRFIAPLLFLLSTPSYASVSVGGNIALSGLSSSGGTVSGPVTITGATSPMLSVQNSSTLGSNTVIVGNVTTTTNFVVTNDGAVTITQLQPPSVAGNGTAALTSTWLLGTGGNSSGVTGQTGGQGAGFTVNAGAGGAVTGASGIGGQGGAIGFTTGGGGNGVSTGTQGAGGAFTISTGAGANATSTGTGANGGALTATLGNGGSAASGTTGTGGGFTFTSGNGGADTGAAGANTGGAGGAFAVAAGAGGSVTSATGVSGDGGAITLTAGNASNSGATGGSGGAVTITSGTGGNGTTNGGVGGNININAGNAGTGGNNNGGAVTISSGTVTGSGTAIITLKNGTASTSGLIIKGGATTIATFDTSNKRLRLGDATVPTATLDIAGLTTIASTGALTIAASAAVAATISRTTSGNTFVLNGTDGTTNKVTITDTGIITDNHTAAQESLLLQLSGSTNSSGLTFTGISQRIASASGFIELFSDQNSGAARGGIVFGTSSAARAAIRYDGTSNRVELIGVGTATWYFNNTNPIIQSGAATGSNTAFGFTKVNSPTTFMTMDSHMTIPGAAPASVAGNGTAAVNGVWNGTTGGASSGITGQTGGTGSSITITCGTGGAVAGASGIGGAGGAAGLIAGNGGNGAATGGNGGAVSITGGNAGTGGNANGGSITLTSGTLTGSGTAGQIINKSGTNSTAFLLYEQSDGTIFGTWDSTNKRLRIGDATVPTATLDILGKHITNSSGIVSTYNSQTTAGVGQPYIVASGSAGAQTGAVGTVATFTVGSTTGLFEISGFVNVTAWTTPATFNLQVIYTDDNNTSRTTNIPVCQTAGTYAAAITATGVWQGSVLTIAAKNATAITIATAGTFTGSPTYNVYGVIKQIQ